MYKKFERKNRRTVKTVKKVKQYASDTEQNEETQAPVQASKAPFRLAINKIKTPLNINKNIMFLKPPLMNRSKSIKNVSSAGNRKAQKKKNVIAENKKKKVVKIQKEDTRAKSEHHKSDRNNKHMF